MQTRSQNRINRREEIYVVPLRERVVTRSQTREKRSLASLSNDNEKEAKRKWFVAYVKKSLDFLVQTDKENLTKEEKILEKVRIVDELFYNVKMYVADIAEFFKDRLLPVMIRKSKDLAWEMYERLHNLHDKKNPLYFTKKEERYLRNVIKNLKSTRAYLVELEDN
jgi:hypothetical protein